MTGLHGQCLRSILRTHLSIDYRIESTHWANPLFLRLGLGTSWDLQRDTSQETNIFVNKVKASIKDAENDVKDGRKRIASAKAPTAKKKAAKAEAEAVSSADESD